MPNILGRHWGWLVLATLAALIVFFPLRLALAIFGGGGDGGGDGGVRGIHAHQVSGTIWSGTAQQVDIGVLRLGQLRVGLNPLQLPLARLQMSFSRDANHLDGPLSGTAVAGFGWRALADLNGSVTGPASNDVPIQSIQFDQFNASFDDGRCTAASGTVRVILGLRIAGLDLRNGLSGTASCRRDALYLPLVGQSGMERLTLSIKADGAYHAQLSVRADDPLLAAALVAAGLVPVSDGFGLTLRGQF